MIIDARMRPPFKSFDKVLAPPLGAKPSLRKNYLFRGYDSIPSVTQKSLDTFFREMEEAGIDKGVLVGRRASTRQINNEDIAELRQKCPDKFVASVAGIDVTQNILSGLKEIEHCINDLGFNGIVMDPGFCTPPYYVDDKRVYPFYAKCAEMGCVLYLSVSLMQGPDISYAEPCRIQRVANDFPTLKILVVHSGFPFTNEMLGVMIANASLGNIYVLGDFFWAIPGFPGHQDWVDAANNYIGDRIVYGGCYPARPLKLALEQFKELSFRSDVVDNLLCKNAAEFFGVDFQTI